MPFQHCRHWLAGAFLGLLSILPASAIDDIKPEEIEAFKAQIKEAEKGDANAQLHVGHCYFNGWGVKRDEIEAAKWYKKSADQGNETASFYLDRCWHKAANNEFENIPKGQTLDKSVADRKVGPDKSSEGPASKAGNNHVATAPNSQQATKSEKGNKPESNRLILDTTKRDSSLSSYNNHSTYSRYRYGPAIAFAVWIIGAVVAFFMNIYRRVSLEKRLADDPRFTAKFFFHSKRLPIPETPSIWSSGWIIGGIYAALIGFFLAVGVGGAGLAFGLLLMIGGAFVAVYDYNHDISQSRQAPGNQLSEVEFHKDHLKATYSITGSKCYNFGPDVSISIQTRETYQNGVGLNNNNHSQMFTGIGVFASFSGPAGYEELELDFPGAAEFLAHCRHNGSELKFSLNCDARIVARLTESRSWQPGWKPDDLSQASEEDHSSAKPKLWNPLATAIWSFIFCAALGSWLQAANWRELNKHDKARRSMGWFYGYLATAIAYVFIIPYFFITPEIVDFTWPTIFFTIWYFASGRGQIRYFRESNIIYEKKGWLKPILATSAIIAAWIGILFCSDEFFQATLRADAYRGAASAQRSLAWMYANGKGVSEDQEEASRLYRKAAEQGDQYAQAVLGIRLQEGKGTPKNEVEALKWLRLSANQGNDVAQNMMGVCYSHGVGIEKNLEEAAKWYRKSAENGYAESQNELGYCYFNGNGVQKDLVESLKWHRMAADQGDAEAQYIVGTRHATGAGTEKSASMAVIWYRRAAEQGYAPAQFLLGNCYASGLGVEANPIETVKWYTKAADQGNMRAQHYLGNCYYNGQGTTPNLPEALKYWRLAADAGYGESQYNIGVCHLEGIGVPKDEVMALIWLRKAAGQGDAGAQFALGRFHLGRAASNLSIKKDMTEAYAYFTLAGVTLEKARKELADLEKKMDAQSISNGKKRALDLKKEIEAKSSGPQPSK